MVISSPFAFGPHHYTTRAFTPPPRVGTRACYLLYGDAYILPVLPTRCHCLPLPGAVPCTTTCLPPPYLHRGSALVRLSWFMVQHALPATLPFWFFLLPHYALACKTCARVPFGHAFTHCAVALALLAFTALHAGVTDARLPHTFFPAVCRLLLLPPPLHHTVPFLLLYLYLYHLPLPPPAMPLILPALPPLPYYRFQFQLFHLLLPHRIHVIALYYTTCHHLLLPFAIPYTFITFICLVHPQFPLHALYT